MHTVYRLPGTNGAGSKLTVTSTAQGIEDLVRTAASDPSWDLDKSINAIDLNVESESIRWFDDGNMPTSAIGIPLVIGGVERIRGLSIKKLKLVSSTGSDATVIIRIGKIYNNG